MKKGIVLFLVLVVMLSTVVVAVSYGSKIQRFQMLPGEEARAEIEHAKAIIAAGGEESVEKRLEKLAATIDDMHKDLKSTVDEVALESNNARTESNVQISNVLSAISNLKVQMDELRDVKRLSQELPSLLEQPREIISPRILVNLSVLNLALLVVLIGLVLFVKREHDTAHAKTTPHGHPELHDYIKQHIKKGVHINTIRSQLTSHDWDPAEVDEAIRQVRES